MRKNRLPKEGKNNAPFSVCSALHAIYVLSSISYNLPVMYILLTIS